MRLKDSKVRALDLLAAHQRKRLDPEDLREAIQSYQDAAADVIGRLDRHIAQYLGTVCSFTSAFPRRMKTTVAT